TSGVSMMSKAEITSSELAAPVGQFSQATIVKAQGTIVFVSGMTARGTDGKLVGVGDIEAQARQGCQNIRSGRDRAGGSLADVCRVDVYVRNMEHFSIIHMVRAEFFNAPLPSSTMVEVTKMVHPDMLIEITAIGVIQQA